MKGELDIGFLTVTKQCVSSAIPVSRRFGLESWSDSPSGSADSSHERKFGCCSGGEQCSVAVGGSLELSELLLKALVSQIDRLQQ